MNTTFIISLISVFFAFIIPSLFYKMLSSNNSPFSKNTKMPKSLFLPFAVSSFALCSLIYPLIFSNYDFLYPFSYTEMVTPFLLAILLFLCSKNSFLSKYFIILLLLACIACSFTLPQNSLSAIIPIPAIYTQMIAVVTWFLFSYLYRYANNGGATLGIQSAAIAIGISCLGFAGAIPLFLSILAMIISAAFLAIIITTWPPANKTISDNSASCFGFIIFALIAWCGQEQAISCAAIFSLYFIADFLWALALRLTFAEQYSNIKENTSYRQALAQGISPQIASSFLCRAQFLLIMFGIFQAYSSQQYSMLLVSALISIWLLSKMRNLSENNKTIKDLNKEVLEDIQARINNIKQYINKDENDQ